MSADYAKMLKELGARVKALDARTVTQAAKVLEDRVKESREQVARAKADDPDGIEAALSDFGKVLDRQGQLHGFVRDLDSQIDKVLETRRALAEAVFKAKNK